MAFALASPTPLLGLGSAGLDMLPSFSATISAPWRALGRPASVRGEAQSQRRGLATKAPTRPRLSQETTKTLKSPARTQICEPLATIPARTLTRSYSSQILGSDYTAQGILAGFPRQSPQSQPLALRLLRLTPSTRSNRSISTSSRFGPLKIHTIPWNASSLTPLQIIRNNSHVSHNQLSHMESTANNNPASVSSQTAFYTALLRANMPQILIERYETGRYATNTTCDALYVRALERMGQSQGGEGALANGRDSNNAMDPSLLRTIGRAAVTQARGATQGLSARGGTGARMDPIHVTVDESRGAFIWKIVKFLLVYGFIAYFIIVLITLGIETTGILRGAGGRSTQNAEVKPEQQTARFSDVKGCDEAIEELKEIVDFLKSPDKYNQLGGKLPKGVLMVGPPGTGKTLLARAVAGEAGVPFFYMAGSEFDEIYVGVGAKRVRELFQNAKAKAPAIVFIDELDAVGGKRNERDASYHMQTLNQMLTELDGFDQTAGVVFIAATNFPQMLDKALTRPGRFDRQVVVGLPDVRGRVDILKEKMKAMKISTDVDAAVIARNTTGFSGADLENLVNQAAVHASKSGLMQVTMGAMEWARDRIIMGAERKSAVIQEKDKVMTAYHEAGHALVAMYTEGADPLYKCTIMPRGGALGVTHYLPEMDKVSMAKKEYQAWIDICFGGKAAEEIIYGEKEVSSGCSSDLSKATGIAFGMVREFGMTDKFGGMAFDDRLYQSLSSETKRQIEAEARRMLDEGQERARKILRDNKNQLELLARALLKYETLNKEEMEKVVRGETLPEKMKSEISAPMKIPELPIPSSGIPAAEGGAQKVDAGGSVVGASNSRDVST